ncbi:MAG: hypothetical protein IKU15_00830 [Clostridia bacterium]|nr:hypothetical protein [Clostridia bacterium]
MVTLYKRDKKGKVRAWTIEHDDKSYWTISGIHPDGKMTKTAPTFVEQKNVGKANETSLEQQVLNEVASKIQYQIDQGFTYDIPTEEKRFEVSLANKYQDRIEKNKLDFPYIVEPKLDGVRCYIKMVDGVIRMFSRKHKEFVACPHIAKNDFVQKFFEVYPDGILDGELYNHELKDDFNKIVSLVKKTKPKAEDLEESAKLVQYHCFDSYLPSIPKAGYRIRKRILIHLLHRGFGIGANATVENPAVGSVCFVGLTFAMDDIGLSGYHPVKWVAHEEEVEQAILEATAKGYEGIMLKKDVPYFFGRSFDMLKYKKFFDKEYRIVDFEEGNGNLVGIASAVICETEDGQTFKAGVTGTQEYAAELFANKEKYVGKLATIKYQALTPIKEGKGGVPRFGKMTAIRDYEA